MTKTASGLVEYCRAQLGKPYWWGTFGQTATVDLYNALKAQWPKYYTADDFKSQYGKRVHDCVGLLKGYRWSDSPTSVPRYNASQDVAVPGLYSQCNERGTIASMPDLPGICVFIRSEHVGVYIGGGQVIEARGHAYGVVLTRLKDRAWTHWGKPAWISYDSQTDNQGKVIRVPARELSKGNCGSSVRAMQILLNGYGFGCGEADSDFGSKTKSALESYQQSKGLIVDGICGENTWTALIG